MSARRTRSAPCRARAASGTPSCSARRGLFAATVAVRESTTVTAQVNRCCTHSRAGRESPAATAAPSGPAATPAAAQRGPQRRARASGGSLCARTGSLRRSRGRSRAGSSRRLSEGLARRRGQPGRRPAPPGVRLGTRLSARTCAGRAQQRRLPGGVATLQWREWPSGLSMMWIVAEVLYMGSQPSPVCGSTHSAARAAAPAAPPPPESCAGWPLLGRPEATALRPAHMQGRRLPLLPRLCPRGCYSSPLQTLQSSTARGRIGEQRP